MARYNLPARVTLPRAPTIDHTTLIICLRNPSRQVIHLWRKHQGFPKSFKDGRGYFVFTDAVEKWLAERRNVIVERVQ